jgi:hypothetical protein
MKQEKIVRPCSTHRQGKTFSGILNILGSRLHRRHRMHSPAGRAYADIRFESEFRTASLTDCLKTSVSDRLVPHRSTMGVIDKFNKLAPLGKGPTDTITAATTS